MTIVWVNGCISYVTCFFPRGAEEVHGGGTESIGGRGRDEEAGHRRGGTGGPKLEIGPFFIVFHGFSMDFRCLRPTFSSIFGRFPPLFGGFRAPPSFEGPRRERHRGPGGRAARRRGPRAHRAGGAAAVTRCTKKGARSHFSEAESRFFHGFSLTFSMFFFFFSMFFLCFSSVFYGFLLFLMDFGWRRAAPSPEDWFAIPQITSRAPGVNEDLLKTEAAKAVQSIPAYVEAREGP